MTLHVPFDNSYARLPSHFYARVAPTPVSAPRLIAFNRSLAQELGLESDAFTTPEGVDVLAGKHVPEGAEPLAMAYAGHQFGHFAPQLGDGRAILLGEIIDRHGKRRDLQLKGSGRTPFSRGGDGRAALGPVLREYVVSEAMAALGIPTTRALAAVSTGDRVFREEILPGAVLTRVAESHIRVGTFQFFASRGNVEGLRHLADYVIGRNYPDLADRPEPYRALLDAVIARQASLVSRWLLVGFIHGVMNTDNMAISGETIDYGPCAFMDAYHPETVFSSIDRSGRYAFANQPAIAQWNLARLAECFIPLLHTDQETGLEMARTAVGGFADSFHREHAQGMRRKLGLATEQEGDLALAQDLLDRMAAGAADFTLTFRRLCNSAEGTDHDGQVRSLFTDPGAFDDWAVRWRERLAREPEQANARAAAMRTVNPAFIPRNHRVEEVITAAVERDDFGPFEALLHVLANPYEDQPANAAYQDPPLAGGKYVTYCGT